MEVELHASSFGSCHSVRTDVRHIYACLTKVRAAECFGTASQTTGDEAKFCGCDDHCGVQVDGVYVDIPANSALYPPIQNTKRPSHTRSFPTPTTPDGVVSTSIMAAYRRTGGDESPMNSCPRQLAGAPKSLTPCPELLRTPFRRTSGN